MLSKDDDSRLSFRAEIDANLLNELSHIISHTDEHKTGLAEVVVTERLQVTERLHSHRCLVILTENVT